MIRGLCKLPDGRDRLRGKLGLALVLWAMLSKFLIQLSAVLPPCSLFGLRQPNPRVYKLLLFCCCLDSFHPMDCSTPGFPVLLYLPEFAQIHAYRLYGRAVGNLQEDLCQPPKTAAAGALGPAAGDS